MSTISPTQGATGRFELGHAISVTRGLMNGTKRYVFLIGLLLAATEFAVDRLFGPNLLADRPVFFLYCLVTGVVSGVTVLAYATVGLLVVSGERLSFSRAFSEMRRLPAVLMVTVPLTALFMYLDAALGTGWWMLLGLLALPMGLWPLYLVDRELDPLSAIARSYGLVFNNFGESLLYALLSAALGALVGLTLGIALIWVAPFLIIVQAVMFSMAEGVEGAYGP